MTRSNRALFLALSLVALIVAVAHGQGQQVGRGGGAPAGGRAGGPALLPLMQTPPRPAIANAKAVRSCDSLASVAVPNTTIESAALDPNNPAVCRVTAITTHSPSTDKTRIWVAIPTSNWNGRFVGTGGGGLVSNGDAPGSAPMTEVAMRVVQENLVILCSSSVPPFLRVDPVSSVPSVPSVSFN